LGKEVIGKAARNSLWLCGYLNDDDDDVAQTRVRIESNAPNRRRQNKAPPQKKDESD
jgi:hypothetical protein